jgi:hypothetical protein
VVIDLSGALAAQVAVGVGSLVSVLLAGRRTASGTARFPRAPWLLLIGSHGLFLGYALVSGQPGFLLLNVGMVVAGVINLRAGWKRHRRDRVAQPEDVAVPPSATWATPAKRD